MGAYTTVKNTKRDGSIVRPSEKKHARSANHFEVVASKRKRASDKWKVKDLMAITLETAEMQELEFEEEHVNTAGAAVS